MKYSFLLILLCISLAAMAEDGPGFSPSATISYFPRWESGSTTFTDVKTGAVLQTLEGPDNYGSKITFSKDEKKIALLSGERWPNQMKVIAITTGKTLFQVDEVSSATFSPDGTRVYVNKISGETIQLDGLTGQLQKNISAPLDGTASFDTVVSNDGKIAAVPVINDTFQIVDLQSGKVLKTIRKQGFRQNRITNVAISEDSKQVYFSYTDDNDRGEAAIFSLNSNQEIPAPWCVYGCEEVKFFSNDKMLSLGGRFGDDIIVNLAENKISEIEDSRIKVRSFLSNGKFMVVTTERHVGNDFRSFLDVYNLTTNQKVQTYMRSDKWGEYLSCAFSADGKEIIAILEDGSLEKHMFP